MPKKKPPSYYRYKKKHPTVSIVVTKEMKDKLDNFRGEESYGRAIKNLLDEKLDPVQQGYENGYKVGYAEGVTLMSELCLSALHEYEIYDLDNIFKF